VLDENISFDTLEQEGTVWNLMLFSGYLTLTENKEIRFVNKEVRNFYISIFKNLAGSDITAFNRLLDYLINRYSAMILEIKCKMVILSQYFQYLERKNSTVIYSTIF